MVSGKLFVIPTPVGNLDDITLRALRVFETIDLLACEDTRVAGKLMSRYTKKGLISHKPRYVLYNDYNARESWERLVEFVKAGTNLGLISDAGMPTISDPGYRLVRGCYDAGLDVEVLPGASSVIVAVAASGLGGEHFIFTGFLPKKAGKRTSEIKRLAQTMELFSDIRIVILVTPHRIEKDLLALEEVMGDRVRVVLLRELTKKFEERIELKLPDLLKLSEEKKIKGEIILVLSNS